MLSICPLKYNSITVEPDFLLASISVTISSNTVNAFFSLSDSSLLNFYKYHQLSVNNQ